MTKTLWMKTTNRRKIKLKLQWFFSARIFFASKVGVSSKRVQNWRRVCRVRSPKIWAWAWLKPLFPIRGFDNLVNGIELGTQKSTNKICQIFHFSANDLFCSYLFFDELLAVTFLICCQRGKNIKYSFLLFMTNEGKDHSKISQAWLLSSNAETNLCSSEAVNLWSSSVLTLHHNVSSNKGISTWRNS